MRFIQVHLTIDRLVSSFLSKISESSAQVDPPQIMSTKNHQLERNNCLSLLSVKTTMIEANIGAFNLDMHFPLPSIIEVLRRGMIFFLHHFPANLSSGINPSKENSLRLRPRDA